MADNEAVPQATLRETIEAAVDEHATDAATEPVGEVAPAAEATPAPEPVGDDRPRGPDGKFIPKAEAAPVREQPAAAPESVVQAQPRPKPPSSWKKDYHEHWEKIDPKVAEYINQRESEYARGVSTYKQEYERLAPIGEVLAPVLPMLQQHNVEPARFVGQLVNAHQVLSQGAPEARLSMFLKLARDYNVPVQQLFQQGQDGKVYFNPQVAPYQPPAPQVDVNGLVERKIAEMYSKQQIQGFEQQRDGSGNTAHPHYETVRETMAQLLEAGLADDLESAYQAALAHPRHADLAAAERQQREAAGKAEQARKAAEAAQRARRSAISPRSATPATAGANGKKGLRATLEDTFDQFGGGRV